MMMMMMTGISWGESHLWQSSRRRWVMARLKIYSCRYAKCQKTTKIIHSSIFLRRYLRSLRGTFDAKCNLRPIKQSVKLSFEYPGSLCMRRHIARTAGNCPSKKRRTKSLKAHKKLQKSRAPFAYKAPPKVGECRSVLAAPSRWQRIQRIDGAGFAGIDAWHTDTDWSWADKCTGRNYGSLIQINRNIQQVITKTS